MIQTATDFLMRLMLPQRTLSVAPQNKNAISSFILILYPCILRRQATSRIARHRSTLDRNCTARPRPRPCPATKNISKRLQRSTVNSARLSPTPPHIKRESLRSMEQRASTCGHGRNREHLLMRCRCFVVGFKVSGSKNDGN
jgi:hypothetical protein